MNRLSSRCFIPQQRSILRINFFKSFFIYENTFFNYLFFSILNTIFINEISFPTCKLCLSIIINFNFFNKSECFQIKNLIFAIGIRRSTIDLR